MFRESNNIWFDLFPDPVGHFKQAVRCCRLYGVAGGERVPPSLLYFQRPNFFTSRSSIKSVQPFKSTSRSDKPDQYMVNKQVLHETLLYFMLFCLHIRRNKPIEYEWATKNSIQLFYFISTLNNEPLWIIFQAVTHHKTPLNPLFQIINHKRVQELFSSVIFRCLFSSPVHSCKLQLFLPPSLSVLYQYEGFKQRCKQWCILIS